MADCTVTLNIGDGPDEAVHGAEVKISRPVEGVSGGLDILPVATTVKALRGGPHTTVDLEQGKVFRFEFPRHKLSFYKLIPAASTALYSTLTDVPPTPAAPIPAGPELAETISEIMAGTYVAKGSQIVDVRDFGAVGNGIADDTAAFQAAVDAIDTSAGGTLLVPPGTYFLAGQITICSDLTVEGSGATITKVGTTTSSVTFASFSNGTVGYGSGASRFVVRGLRFLGSFTSGAVRSNVAFSGNHADDVTFEDCTFTEVQNGSHTFDLQGCRRVTIRRCTWNGFNAAHATALTRPYAEAIQLDCSLRSGATAPDAAGSYDGLPTTDVVVEDCSFLPLTIGGTTHPCPNPIGSHAVVEGQAYRNITFRRNVVDTPATDITSAYQGVIHLTGAQNVTIEDNDFRFVSSNDGFGILFLRGALVIPMAQIEDVTSTAVESTNVTMPKNLRIRGNRFRGFKPTNTNACVISIVGDDRDPAYRALDVAFVGNRFEDCHIDGTTNNGATLIRIYSTKEAEVTGNVSTKARRLLYARRVADLRVTANAASTQTSVPYYFDLSTSITMTGNSARDSNTPVLAADCDQVTITGNAFEETTSATAVSIQNTTRFTVVGNTLKNTIARTQGVRVHGTSNKGQVRANFIEGFTSLIDTTGAGTEIVTDGRADVLTLTAAATLTVDSPRIVLANATTAAFTVTLPTTTRPGVTFTVKRTSSGANAVTVGGTIDGATNYALSTQHAFVEVMSTSTSGAWVIVGKG